MERQRSAGFAPKTVQLSRNLGRINTCIGCADCRGICKALIELAATPDAVLRREDGS